MSTNAASTRNGIAQAVRDPQRRGRMILGAVSFMIAAGYFMEALDMPRGTTQQPGPGLWPIAVGVAWMAISVIVFIEAALSPQLGGTIDLPSGIERRNVLIFLGATIVFVTVLPFLGQYIAASLYAIAIIKLLSNLSWVRSALYGIALGGGISLAFMTILQLRLPVGLFGGF